MTAPITPLSLSAFVPLESALWRPSGSICGQAGPPHRGDERKGPEWEILSEPPIFAPFREVRRGLGEVTSNSHFSLKNASFDEFKGCNRTRSMRSVQKYNKKGHILDLTHPKNRPVLGWIGGTDSRQLTLRYNLISWYNLYVGTT